MSYFSKFPLMAYDITQPGDTKNTIIAVRDIIRRVRLKEKLERNAFAYDIYDVVDGERPDTLAHQFYNDSELAWVILVTNEIHDIYADWPKSESELRKCVICKYGSLYDIHHYERPQASGDTTKMVRTSETTYSIVTDIGTVQVLPSISVTNLEYESRLNEEKRRIKILRPELIQSFIEDFENIIGV